MNKILHPCVIIKFIKALEYMILWVNGRSIETEKIQLFYDCVMVTIPTTDAKRLNKIIFEEDDDIYSLSQETALNRRLDKACLALQKLKNGLENDDWEEAIDEFLSTLFENHELVFTIFPFVLLKRDLYVDSKNDSPDREATITYKELLCMCQTTKHGENYD